MANKFEKKSGGPEISTPNLEKIAKLPLHYNENEFVKVAQDTKENKHVSIEVSEDALVGMYKTLTETSDSLPWMNMSKSIINILKRPSMSESPKRQLFIDGLKELYKKFNEEEPDFEKLFASPENEEK